MQDAQEQILDHYHHPRCRVDHIDCNDSAHTHCAHDVNASCGDQVTVAIDVVDGVIQNIHWTGEGCAISQASASLLAEHLTGKPLSIAQDFSDEQMLELIKLPLSPARVKCATLTLRTLHAALQQN
jgi:nitrogen fixation NifU-like protein